MKSTTTARAGPGVQGPAEQGISRRRGHPDRRQVKGPEPGPVADHRRCQAVAQDAVAEAEEVTPGGLRAGGLRRELELGRRPRGQVVVEPGHAGLDDQDQHRHADQARRDPSPGGIGPVHRPAPRLGPGSRGVARRRRRPPPGSRPRAGRLYRHPAIAPSAISDARAGPDNRRLDLPRFRRPVPCRPAAWPRI